MSYRDALRPASFRGVAFYIDTAGTSFGRRKALHEYPQRPTPWAEDLGRKAREIQVEAHLMTPDDFALRDRFIKVLEDYDTPGTLIHPSLGSMMVVPTECRVNYSNQEGGVEYFSITFVEAGSNQFPSGKLDTPGDVAQSVSKARTALGKAFQVTYKTAGFPDRVAQTTTPLATQFMANITQAMAQPGQVPDQASTQRMALTTYAAGLASAIVNPTVLGATTQTLMWRLGSLFTSPTVGFSAYSAMATRPAVSASVINTPSQRQAVSNQRAYAGLIYREAVLGMALTSSQMTWPSYDDAITTRNTVAVSLDEAIVSIGDTNQDELLDTLADVRRASVIDITERAANLRRIRTIQLLASVPALVQAYDLYEDSTQDGDIVARNRVPHPLFLPAGRPLQVLS